MPAEVSEVDMDVNAAVGHVDERLPGISCRWNVMKFWGTAVGITYQNIKLNDNPNVCIYIM